MHTHTFSDLVFARLQNHASPLIDTIDDVISRALDALEAVSAHSAVIQHTSKALGGAKQFDAASPPSLKHTVPRRLVVDGSEILKDIYWNTLLCEVIRAASMRGLDTAEILSLIRTPAKSGEFSGPGYRYVADAGLSFQQLNSDRAWSEAYHIAHKVGIPIIARWVWQYKDKAYMPGGTGMMHFST